MSNPPPTAPIDPSLPPPLHELDWQKFERLTVDLYAFEPDVATSDPYGKGGQAQFGIDVVARRVRSDGIEVASCKSRVEDISANDLETWSNDFLKHWDTRWKKRDIRRFILATTARNTELRQIQDQIDVEIARFKPLGIDYELWSPKQFAVKLRSQRALALTYLGETWATHICGPATNSGTLTGSAQGLVSAALIAQVAELQARLSGHAQARLEEALVALRAGRRGDVEAVVGEMRSAAQWSQLESHVQARVLRLAAGLRLKDHDLEGAFALDEEAELLFPSQERRMAAQIASDRDGPEAGLARLGTPTTVDGRHLQAVLQLIARRLDDTEASLAILREEAPDHPETIRIEALLALARGDRALALERTLAAEQRAPEWLAVRQLGVITRYANAVSPVLSSDWYFYPNAIDDALTRRDLEAQHHLEQALTIVDALIAAEPAEGLHKVWRLAVLASLRAQRSEATAYARSLLAELDHEPTVIAWALYRGLDIDLEPSFARLHAAYEDGAEVMQVRMLAILYASKEAPLDAIAVLRASLDRQSGDSAAEARNWIARFSIPSPGDDGAAGDDLGLAYVPGRAFRTAVETNDAPAAAAAIEEALHGEPVDPAALAMCEMAAAHGLWDELAPQIDRLLAFGTAAAVRIAVFTAYNHDEPARAIEIIAAHEDAFGEALPNDIKRLAATSRARLGDIPGAIGEFAQIAAQTGSAGDRLRQAELLVTIGDIRGSMPMVRAALDADALSAEEALRWSRAIRSEDPALSRSLFLASTRLGIPDEWIVTARIEAAAIGLGTTPEAQALSDRMFARAAAGAPDVRFAVAEEHHRIEAVSRNHVDQLERAYQHGAITSHMRYAGDIAEFVRAHLGVAGPDQEARPRYVRHGARPRIMRYDRAWSSWRIRMDISALLEAHRLDIIDQIERHPHGILISPLTPQILMEAERLLAQGLMSRADALRAARASVEVAEPDDQETASVTDELLGALLTTTAPPVEAGQLTQAGPIVAIPPDGTTLKLPLQALVALGDAGALPALATRYRLIADRADLAQIIGWLNAAEREEAVASSTRRLRERIAAGIISRVYRLLPSANAGDEPAGERLEPLERALADVLEAPGEPDAIAWIDDRFATGHPVANETALLGTAEALVAMASDPHVEGIDLEERLADWRGSAANFLPFDPAEILGPLLAAKVKKARVVETDALIRLRRAIAAENRAEATAKIGGSEYEMLAEQPDEFEVVSSSNRLLPECLEAIWTRPGLSNARRCAYSDWLWANCRKTHFGRAVPAASQDLFEVLHYANCLEKASEITGLKRQGRELASQYLSWFWFRALAPMIEADPTFLDRLAAHLANFYSELEARQLENRTRREADMVRVLVAMRIDTLPAPVRSALFQQPIMSNYGFSVDQVTIGRTQFESKRFWRAMRQAYRYGKAHVRDDRKRIARLRRKGAGVSVAGAARGFVADDMLAIQAVGRDEGLRLIDRMIERLHIGSDGDALAQNVRRANSPGALAVAVKELRAVSAEAGYHEIRNRLARRESFRIDLLAPRSLGSIMRRLGLPERFDDLQAELPGAVNMLTTILPSSDDVPIRLAGLASRLPDGVKPDWKALAARARTPLALIQAAIEARRQQAPVDALVALIERLAATIADWGQLFITLLYWTQRHGLRQAEWQTASPAMQLTAIWCHSDQILDLLIGSGISAAGLDKLVGDWKGQIQGIDIIGLAAGGQPDASAPAGMSRAVLLYHGLAAIFGGDDVSAALPADLLETIRAALMTTVGEITSPDVMLLMRMPTRANLLGGFLTEMPTGVLADNLDPVRTRQSLVESGLSALEAGGDRDAAWSQLAAFGSGGLDAAQHDRLKAQMATTALAPLAQAHGYQIWRALIFAIASVDKAVARATLMAIVTDCAQIDRVGGAGDWRPEPGEAIFELVETAGILANRADRPDVGFADLFVAMGRAWPALAPYLADTLSNVIATTRSSRAGALWQAWLILRSLP